MMFLNFFEMKEIDKVKLSFFEQSFSDLSIIFAILFLLINSWFFIILNTNVLVSLKFIETFIDTFINTLLN